MLQCNIDNKKDFPEDTGPGFRSTSPACKMRSKMRRENWIEFSFRFYSPMDKNEPIQSNNLFNINERQRVLPSRM